MHTIRFLVLAANVSLIALSSPAAEPTVRTLMTERGKLLLNDDFKQPLGSEWHMFGGKWEVVDGAVRSPAIVPGAHHPLLLRDLEFRNVVVQYSFRFEDAQVSKFNVFTKQGHLCCVDITPAGFTVKKNDTDKAGPDKAVFLEKRSMPIAPGQWHTLLIEIQGQEMLASLDGKEVGFGEHAAIDAPKARLNVTAGGGSVSFRDLRVWEAMPNKDWPAAKVRLIQARKDITPASK